MHVWRQAASVSKQTLVGPSGFNVNRQCKMRDGVCYFVVNFFYNPSITMHVSPGEKREIQCIIGLFLLIIFLNFVIVLFEIIIRYV